MSSAHLARYAPLQEMAKEYIAEHRVQQMFSSLLSALVMHRPEDPIAFIQMKLDEVKRVGPENVNWETFIYELHPMRDPVRLELIKDDSPYQKEATRKEAGEEDEAKYTPDVFKLTENGSSTPTS